MVTQFRFIVDYFCERRAVVKGDWVNELWRGGGGVCCAGGGMCCQWGVVWRVCVDTHYFDDEYWKKILLKREAFIMLVFDWFRFFT
ncbi:hypothetical protein [uncultured Gimesia sp.]|mgnify:CR=1 FL=1|uniref:hypothetical protein n=1 Tax=uncultured Gimesia sp. TaxID=1678688 RepID=UPI0026130C8C|nr:hypothetical protein [uncultured Gimesia sp.]